MHITFMNSTTKEILGKSYQNPEWPQTIGRLGVELPPAHGDEHLLWFTVSDAHKNWPGCLRDTMFNQPFWFTLQSVIQIYCPPLRVREDELKKDKEGFNWFRSNL